MFIARDPWFFKILDLLHHIFTHLWLSDLLNFFTFLPGK
jgi:hypothetical protein